MTQSDKPCVGGEGVVVGGQMQRKMYKVRDQLRVNTTWMDGKVVFLATEKGQNTSQQHNLNLFVFTSNSSMSACFTVTGSSWLIMSDIIVRLLRTTPSSAFSFVTWNRLSTGGITLCEDKYWFHKCWRKWEVNRRRPEAWGMRQCFSQKRDSMCKKRVINRSKMLFK